MFNNTTLKLLLIACLASALSACIGTDNSTNSPAIVVTPTFERMDATCIEQVNTQQASLEKATISQYLSLANSAEYCVGDIEYSPQHPDNQTAMQFSALAIVNFVKAGDMQSAKLSLEQFRQRFPQQDLTYNDFTSFVDTATALINKNKLSPNELMVLNINPTLRAEIKRNRQWSMN